MSFAFIFDREDDIYQFSYCYPYSYTKLQNYLDSLEKKNMDYFTRELLCLTVVSNCPLWAVSLFIHRSSWKFYKPVFFGFVEQAYLTFLHKALNLFRFDCEIILESVPGSSTKLWG